MNSFTTYAMRTCVRIALLWFSWAGLTASTPVAADVASTTTGGLSFEERVAAQKAIEEVYWSHRIWPQENGTPKPSLSSVMSDETVRAKVDDYLRKSNALETWWHRPITAVLLQAEMDRMARDTHNAAMLRGLYAALGNDPTVIAETLARQTLVERLIRNWYASDERFHGDLKREIERTLVAGNDSVDSMKSLSGDYSEVTLLRRGEEQEEAPRKVADEGMLELDSEGWQAWRSAVARRFGTTPEAIPVRRLSGLQEDQERFFVTAVLSLERQKATVATVVWPKHSFDVWWSAERGTTSAAVTPEAGSYSIAAPLGGGACVSDWELQWYLPDPRSRHTAVWTGTEILVWGGYDGSFLNTGGRYNPATDSWIATSTDANVPAARAGHVAVWTGTEMIVWGGSYLNTGGRYNPVTNGWTATSSSGAPSGGVGHTAVWTGTEMIVWGGYNGTYLSTGARYDPSTDSWQDVPAGPAGRELHSAVWTGTAMIVWGGYNGTYLNTGGRFDPSTSAWTTTSVGTNLPAGRRDHTAVWTGTEMIIWGGVNATSLNTGGRYDPSTDTWTATSTGANLPAARSHHTAVWTGTEMIVWGESTAPRTSTPAVVTTPRRTVGRRRRQARTCQLRAQTTAPCGPARR